MMNNFSTLLTQLQSSDVRQRSQAVLQLQPGTGSDAGAIAALVNILCNDDDLNVVEDATWVLVRYGMAATSALLNVISYADSHARHNIVHTLGKLADTQAVPALITATQDSDPSVRLKAVYALGQIGDTQAIDSLIARLDDPIQNIQWTAREVLHGFGSKALPHLIQALTVESAHVRELAASLLGDTGDESAVDPLIAAISTDDHEVRFAIVEALGNIGDSRARPVIEQMVNDPYPPVQAMAKAALKMLNTHKS